EEFNWNLDGYPTEDTKRTEDIDFNWESVVDEREKSRTAETDSDQELLKDKIKSENSGRDEREKSSGAEKTAEEEHEQELEEMIFGTKDREGNISDTMRLDAVEDLDDLSRTTRIDKFYTYNKKNEEFQELLDKEYNRLKAQIEADAARDHVAEKETEPEPAGKTGEATGAEKAEETASPDASDFVKVPEAGETETIFANIGEPETGTIGEGQAAGTAEQETLKPESEPEPVTLRDDVPSGEGFEKEIESDIPAYINSLDAGNLSLAELLKAQTRQEEDVWAEPESPSTEEIPSDSLFSIPDEKTVEGIIDRATAESAGAPSAESVAEPAAEPAMGSSFDSLSAESFYEQAGSSVFGMPEDSRQTTAEEPAYEPSTSFGYEAPAGTGEMRGAEPQGAEEFEIPAFMQNSGSGEPLNVIEDFTTEPAEPAANYDLQQPEWLSKPELQSQYQPQNVQYQPQNVPQQPEPQPQQYSEATPSTQQHSDWQMQQPSAQAQQPDMQSQAAQQPVQYLGVALAHAPKGVIADPSETGSRTAAEPVTDNAGFVPPVQQTQQPEAAEQDRPSPVGADSQNFPGTAAGESSPSSQSIEQMIREDEANGKEQLDGRITFQDVFKDEIQAEKEDKKKKPKKHTGLKILAIILCILIVL
ncbi:MAG: hypothetical protein ACI4WR_07385, partial [Bulleidia sp.]